MTARLPSSTLRAADPIGERPLRFRYSRRQLLSEAAEWLHATAETRPDKPMRRLADLSDLPAPELAEIRPRIVAGCSISVAEGSVWASLPGDGTRIRVAATTGPSLGVFNAIDGRTTLAEMSRRVAAETGWDDDRSFSYCRSLVFHLIELRVTIPADRG
jgi:hypothetical protein